jgi:hypothetical protein
MKYSGFFCNEIDISVIRCHVIVMLKQHFNKFDFLFYSHFKQVLVELLKS